MAEKVLLSNEKHKKASEYIKLLIEYKNTLFKISDNELQIQHLNESIAQLNGAQNSYTDNILYTPKMNAEKGLSDLKTQSDSLKKQIDTFKTEVATMYDAAYADFVDNKILPITDRTLLKNPVDKIKSTREEADSDYNSRNPNALPAKKIGQSGNRLRASFYVNNAIKTFNELKINKIDTLISTTTDPTVQSKLEDAKFKALADLDFSKDKVDTNKVILEDRQKARPVNSDTRASDPNNLTKLAQNPIKEADYTKENTDGIKDEEEQTSASEDYRSFEVIIPTILTNIQPVKLDKSQQIILPQNTGTQLLASDIIDPRKVCLIAPVNYLVPVPAYFKVYNENGEPAPETTLSESADATKKSESIIKNPPKDLKELLTPGGNYIYNQFSITGIDKNFGQKVQIEETWSEGLSVLAFGSKPKIWNLSGILINDLVSRWKSKFEEAFENYLNISALTRQKAYLRIVIPADLIQINCYPLDLNVSTRSSNPSGSPFNMPVLVRNYSPLTQIQASQNFIKLIVAFNTLNSSTHTATTGNLTVNIKK